MGRFETTVEFYRHREPYPAAFFEEVSRRLALTAQTRLLDVACGPGLLAIGFAPFVGSCTAIDREHKMLLAAQQAASQAGVNVAFIETAIENFEARDNSFDLLTIGRALHWLPREESIAVFDRILAPGGRIAICGSAAGDSPANRWVSEYKKLRRAWSSAAEEERHNVDAERWFSSSRLKKVDEVSVAYKHTVTIEDLTCRALSFSITSPAVVGDRRPQFEADVRTRLGPFAQGELIEEELTVKATVFG
ncbi:MAG TPA: class I SAM-dependent methyltransferase [Bryobacteraceae bacterium]|nr:class I SAM-dependent methyltransferase [Bryobacteraceae bacterium]